MQMKNNTVKQKKIIHHHRNLIVIKAILQIVLKILAKLNYFLFFRTEKPK